MTNQQVIQAATAAIRAMSPSAKAAFINAFEAGDNETSQTIAQAYAIEGVSRQVRLGSLCLESSKTMDGLVEIVGSRL